MSPLRFFLDESVSSAVGRVLMESGHEVILLQEAIARGSPDDLVALAAARNEAILVAIDNDMRVKAKRHGVSNSRYRSLNLLQLRCKEPQAADRIRDALSLIEHEWCHASAEAARRLFVEIQASRIVTNR